MTMLIRTSLTILFFATISIFLIFRIPPGTLGEQAIELMGIAGILAGALCAILARSDLRKLTLKLALVPWVSLLISEAFFDRITSGESAFEGQFSSAAYAEAAVWMLIFVVVALILLRTPHSLSQISKGALKWMSLYALCCIVSAVYSPGPLFSLAWAFKLTMVVSVLALCAKGMISVEDVDLFCYVGVWVFLFLSLMPLIRIFTLDLPMFDAGGRLNASANGLVIIAGTLLILALTLNSLRPRAWLILAALVGLTVMILSGGKAGILSGIVSTMLFFLVQRKIGSTVLFASALIVVSTLVFAFTPLSSYFIQYGESDQGSTLSGRTELWTAAWPDIRQKPILGHGYVASRFISVEVEGAFPDAGNLHNGFLEALYNNGIIGLILLLGLHLGILRNLFRLRKAPPGSHIYKLAVGCFILYINILLNGCFNATFGGHAYSPFILFLALAVIAERLTALAPAMHTFRAQDELVRA